MNRVGLLKKIFDQKFEEKSSRFHMFKRTRRCNLELILKSFELYSKALGEGDLTGAPVNQT